MDVRNQRSPEVDVATSAHGALKMEELATAFPTLRGAPGTNPWNLRTFLSWLCGPSPGSGAFAAGCFLLGVWDSRRDWAADAAELDVRLKAGALRFDFHRALGTWDRPHVAALAAWLGFPDGVPPSPMDVAQATPLKARSAAEVITVQGPEGTMTGARWLVEAWSAEAAARKERRARWPQDLRAAMSVLGRSFPSMEGAPGLAPFDAHVLLAWLCEGRACAAACEVSRFLLGVWNSLVDWEAAAKEDRLPHPELAQHFNLFSAATCWDREHLAALIRWMDAPFWP